jgi:lipopolysaccharide export system protein LptA
MQLFLYGLMFSSIIVQALPNDKNQPLHIAADKQDIDLNEGVVTYSGDVKLQQGTLEINAAKIIVRKDKNHSAESVVAEGEPATYQQQPEIGKPLIHASANSMNYNLKTELLTLDNKVSIEQNGAITKGNHVDYSIKGQTVKASGRVETVIPPQSDKKD